MGDASRQERRGRRRAPCKDASLLTQGPASREHHVWGGLPTARPVVVGELCGTSHHWGNTVQYKPSRAEPHCIKGTPCLGASLLMQGTEEYDGKKKGKKWIARQVKI